MPKIDEVKEFIGLLFSKILKEIKRFIMMALIISLGTGLALLGYMLYKISTFKYD